MLRFLKVCWRVARGDTKTGSYTVISDVISDNLNKICAETSTATNCLSNRAGKSICLPSILWLCPIVPCPMTPCHHLPSILSLHSRRTKDKFLLVLVRPTLPFSPHSSDRVKKLKIQTTFRRWSYFSNRTDRIRNNVQKRKL